MSLTGNSTDVVRCSRPITRARLNALDPPDLVIELPDTTLDEDDELSSLRLAQVAEFAVVEIQQRRSQDPTILLQELQGRIGRHDLP
jgi:hypothetical protein